MTQPHDSDGALPLFGQGPVFLSAKTIKNLEHPSSTWNRLARSTRQRDPFCCGSVWQMSFHQAFGPGRRIFARESADGFISFAENIMAGGAVFLTPVETSWFFGNNILGTDGMALFHDSMELIERYYSHRQPQFVFGGVTPGGAMVKDLHKRFERKYAFRRHEAGIQCAASLAGGVDGYLSRRSPNHRRKLVKQSRKAREAGITFERFSPTSADDAALLYERLLAVEECSWKGSIRSGLLEPRSKRFYAVMLRRLAQTQGARVILARHGGYDIGFIFGGVEGKIYRGQQFSYATAWRDASLGSLLQMEQVKWLCEENAARYDMGPLSGPGMEYKTHWTELRFHIETWVMGR